MKLVTALVFFLMIITVIAQDDFTSLEPKELAQNILKAKSLEQLKDVPQDKIISAVKIHPELLQRQDLFEHIKSWEFLNKDNDIREKFLKMNNINAQDNAQISKVESLDHPSYGKTTVITTKGEKNAFFIPSDFPKSTIMNDGSLKLSNDAILNGMITRHNENIIKVTGSAEVSNSFRTSIFGDFDLKVDGKKVGKLENGQFLIQPDGYMTVYGKVDFDPNFESKISGHLDMSIGGKEFGTVVSNNIILSQAGLTVKGDSRLSYGPLDKAHAQVHTSKETFFSRDGSCQGSDCIIPGDDGTWKVKTTGGMTLFNRGGINKLEVISAQGETLFIDGENTAIIDNKGVSPLTDPTAWNTPVSYAKNNKNYILNKGGHGLLCSTDSCEKVLTNLINAKKDISGQRAIKRALPDPKKAHAIIVGVSDFNGVNNLPSTPQDVASATEFFSNMGVPSNQIVTLINKEATKEKILANIKQAKDSADATGGSLIFYGSTHGMQPGLKDGFRQARVFVPSLPEGVDPRKEKSLKYTINTNEFANAFQDTNTVFITDTCYGINCPAPNTVSLTASRFSELSFSTPAGGAYSHFLFLKRKYGGTDLATALYQNSRLATRFVPQVTFNEQNPVIMPPPLTVKFNLD